MLQGRIFITDHSIRTCKGDYVLDAYSDLSTRKTVFNLNSWLASDDTKRFALAAHELLVQAGVEKSNSYSISNRGVAIASGRPAGKTDPCELGALACRQKKWDRKTTDHDKSGNGFWRNIARAGARFLGPGQETSEQFGKDFEPTSINIELFFARNQRR